MPLGWAEGSLLQVQMEMSLFTWHIPARLLAAALQPLGIELYLLCTVRKELFAGAVGEFLLCLSDKVLTDFGNVGWRLL